MKYAEALRVAEQAVQAGHARLVPDPDSGESGDHRARPNGWRYAEAVRAEVDRAASSPVGCSPTTTC